jgi:hypothetical protein
MAATPETGGSTRAKARSIASRGPQRLSSRKSREVGAAPLMTHGTPTTCPPKRELLSPE